MPGELLGEVTHTPTPTELKPEIKPTSATEPDSIAQVDNKSEASLPQESNPFDSIRQTMDGLVMQIREGKNVVKSKEALSNLLRVRETYYRDIAMAINPDIHPVEGKSNVYRVGNSEIYGGITAMLDATPALASHKDFVRQLALQFSEESETVMAEQPPPKSFAESTMVYVGSSAQDRIQPFAGDVDANEYVKITAPDKKTAILTIAQALQRSSRRPIQIKAPDGSDTTLYLTHITLGKYREGAMAGKPMTWSAGEIQQGHKILQDASGNPYEFTLREACANPWGLSADYIGVSAKSVFGVNKIIDFHATDPNNNVLLDTFGKDTKPMQQVFFDDPSSLHLLDNMHSADSYIKYITTMTDEVRKKSGQRQVSKVKVMKRLYNLCKARGDLESAQEISRFFSSPASAIYQLESRYRLAREAVGKGIMTGDQRQDIKEKMMTVLEKSNQPLAHEASTLLRSPHIHQFYDRFQTVIKELVDADVAEFLESAPSLKSYLQSILEDKNKNVS